MQSSTHNFLIKESPSDNSRALLGGDFCIKGWDNNKKFKIIKIPTLRDVLEDLKIHPENKEVLKKQSRIAKESNLLLVEAQKENADTIYIKAKSECFWTELIETFNGITKRANDIIIKRNNFILENKSKSFIVSIDKAKQFPMDQLLEFNKSGFCKCLWHEEKYGSMHYKKKANTFKCYGCGEWGDVIKVYQKLKDCDFKTALKALQ